MPGILMAIDVKDTYPQNNTLPDRIRESHQEKTTVMISANQTSKTAIDWNVGNYFTLTANKENGKTGVLLASKALTQILFNPMAGMLTNRFGCGALFIVGTVVLSLSAIIYSLSSSYVTLLAARIIQGIGSAFTIVAGLSLVAELYPDDKERSKAIGIAMSGIALGVLVGYPYGSVLYNYVGKIIPFVVLAVLFAIVIGMQIWTYRCSYSFRTLFDGTPMYRLLLDPYIVVALGIIMVSTMSMANLEPTVPIWVIDTMDPPKWQLGLVFLPDSVGYLIGTKCFGVVAKTIGRWVCSLACMSLISLCLLCIPFATSVPQLILPHFGLGLGLGVIDAAIFPLLALLIDLRHEASYGSVYAIAQLAVCLAYGFGPLIAVQIVKDLTFKWFIWGMSGLMLASCPLSLCIKKFSVTEENKPILSEHLDYTSEGSLNSKSLYDED